MILISWGEGGGGEGRHLCPSTWPDICIIIPTTELLNFSKVASLQFIRNTNGIYILV
jgi:hypothetical protein